MKKNNISFYERYKKEQRQRKIEEKIRKKYNIGDDKTIVIEKKSKTDKLIFYLKSFIGIMSKFLIYFLILTLSTIGATVLLNQPLRETFFEMLQIIIV